MKRQRDGFTLVELLIVIAIIGILMAILLPSLGAARASAGRAACSSNVRQIVLAMSNFASDNKDALYNTLQSNRSKTGSAPNSAHGAGNLGGLIGNKSDGQPSYLTGVVGYDPAQPKDRRIHTVNHPTNEVSFYTVNPICGLPGSPVAPGSATTAAVFSKFSKFSDVPNDRALVLDILRYSSTSNHPTNSTPFYQLGFRDGSVKTVQMPKEAYTRWKALGGTAAGTSNNWFVHNDLIRIMELLASGKDPRFAGFNNTNPWPFAANNTPANHAYIPRNGGNTKEGKAHALWE